VIGCCVRRTPPLFPPAKWTQHETTLAGRERTNNVCEGWNNAVRQHGRPPTSVVVGAVERLAAGSGHGGHRTAATYERAATGKKNQESRGTAATASPQVVLRAMLRALGHCVRLQ